LDGKIATYKYDSKWISCRQSRDFTHKLRSRYDAVLVGTNTALKDDPFLTAHSKSKQNPIRAVIDLNLKIPKTHHLFDGTVPTVVMYNKRILKIPTYLVEDKIILAGIDVNAAKKDFGVIIKKLNEFSIKKILIEGGSEVMSSAIFSNCVDSVYFFIAPKIIGGKNAVSVIGGTGVQKISQSLRIKNMQAKKIGQDILITGKLK
jgi:diaminohydroxyphosphoribosylaminopyrimidine deaminase/5-amino-6-(5-phosphoribosylamino)uracil reductase